MKKRKSFLNLKKIQFLEQQKRAENQAVIVHEGMEGAKGKIKVCKTYDEVISEEGSIPPPMKEGPLKFYKPLREVSKYNQNGIVWQAEVNSCKRSAGLLNSRDVDKGPIATMEIKEVRQDVRSTKINMQMDRAHNATPEQRIKEFRKRKDGNQSERNKGLTGIMCKCLSQQSAPYADIDVFDVAEFKCFVLIFEKMAENKVVDQRSKLTHLINYTKGVAEELVKYCIQQAMKICYNNAKFLLMKQYGDLHEILLAYQLEIKKCSQAR